VTGTSVLALKYAGGVMLAADTLGSYGSLARYTELRRLRAVGPYALLGAGGEYSDFQKILDMLDDATTSEAELDDGCRMGAPELHAYLTRVFYARRNKGNPFYNTLLVAGFRDGVVSAPRTHRERAANAQVAPRRSACPLVRLGRTASGQDLGGLLSDP